MMVIGVATNFHLERSEVEPQMRPFLRQGDNFAGMLCDLSLKSKFVIDQIFVTKEIRLSLRCDCFVPRNDRK